jgi:hypothetical protein
MITFAEFQVRKDIPTTAQVVRFEGRDAGFLIPQGNGTIAAHQLVWAVDSLSRPVAEIWTDKYLGDFPSEEEGEFEIRYRDWTARGCPAGEDCGEEGS